MTTPLILQIQTAALDSNSSVTDALRKAKIACAKLNLKEFEDWIELELNGYPHKTEGDLPQYRRVHGVPEGHNPFHGWQPIRFSDSKPQEMWSSAPINMTIPAIEESLKNAKGDGSFEFLYPAELEAVLSNSLNLKNVRLHIKLNVHQIVDILHAVRNILLEWTLNMEKQGVLGENLMFSPEDKKKSEAVTAQTINHFSIGQVGSFVQSAKGSFVQGSVEATTTTTLSQSTLELVQQIDALLPASNLPAEIHAEAQAALGELKQAATASQPDRGRLQKGLETLKRALAPAGETLLKLAVDAAVAKLLNQH